MPKIVNSEEKIEQICNLAYSMFIEVGVENFSLNSFIASLKISKGQFYHYFKTKEELAFEVVKRKSYSLVIHKKDEIAKQNSFKDKLFKFFSHRIDDTDKGYQLRNKIVTGILYTYLNSANTQIKEYKKEMYSASFELIDEIFENEIIRRGLPKEYKKYGRIAIAVSDGMYLQSLVLDDYDFKKEFESYLNDLVKIFEEEK